MNHLNRSMKEVRLISFEMIYSWLVVDHDPSEQYQLSQDDRIYWKFLHSNVRRIHRIDPTGRIHPSTTVIPRNFHQSISTLRELALHENVEISSKTRDDIGTAEKNRRTLMEELHGLISSTSNISRQVIIIDIIIMERPSSR